MERAGRRNKFEFGAVASPSDHAVHEHTPVPTKAKGGDPDAAMFTGVQTAAVRLDHGHVPVREWRHQGRFR